jgi:type 2 lantibiotic biosynthesis protein LanM
MSILEEKSMTVNPAALKESLYSYEDAKTFWKSMFPELKDEEALLNLIQLVSERDEELLKTAYVDWTKEDVNNDVFEDIHRDNGLTEEEEIHFEKLLSAATAHVSPMVCGWEAFFTPFMKGYFKKVYLLVMKSELFVSKEDFFSDLSVQVILVLYQMSYRALVLETHAAKAESLLKGHTPEERGKYFKTILLNSEDFLESVYAEYSVLTSLMIKKISQMTDFLTEIIGNFEKKKAEIEISLNDGESFGKIVDISYDAGDTHNNGKTVIVMNFENNKKLVYKPREMTVEQRFNEFVYWLNEEMPSDTLLPLEVANIHKGDHCGWVSFVEATPCENKEEVRRYYKRVGQILALSYVFGAKDFHHENVIACGEHPIIIDLETLFCPDLVDIDLKTAPSSHVIAKLIYESVSSIALLPTQITNKKTKMSVDLGGLSGSEPQKSPYKSTYIKNSERDDIQIVADYGIIRTMNNLPTVKNERQSSDDYLPEMVKGFEAMYSWILDHKESVLAAIHKHFDHLKYRVLFRPTNTYAQLLATSYHPDILRCALDREIYLHRIGLFAAKSYSPVVQSEYKDMLNLDIPCFTAITTELDIYDSREMKHTAFYKHSAMELVEQKFERLSLTDLNRQIAIIYYSYANILDKEIYKTQVIFKSEGLQNQNQNDNESLEMAKNIFNYSTSKSIEGLQDGLIDRSWMGYIEIEDLMRRVTQVGHNLYSGNSGASIFYASLAAVTKNEAHKKLAYEVLRPVVAYLEATKLEKEIQIGAFNGFYGALYSVYKTAKLFDDSDLLALVKKHLEATAKVLPLSEQHDLIGGNAGALAVLMNMEDTTLLPIASWHKIYNSFLNKFEKDVNQTEEGLWYWGKEGYIGYAHGNAGITPILYELYKRMGRAELLEWVEKSIAFERANFNEEALNWKRSLKDENCSPNWCHGAPGMLLSRISLLKSGYRDEKIEEEVTIAIETTIKKGFGNDMCLCHGDFGNLLILQDAAIYIKDENLKERVQSTLVDMTKVIAERLGNGYFERQENHGIMTGLTGVGYALLKLSDYGESLPNLLSLS